MSAKRIRCECGRVYEPAKNPTCPSCGAQPLVATVESPKEKGGDQPLVRQKHEALDVAAEDAKPLAINPRIVAIIAGAALALIVLVVLLTRDHDNVVIVQPGPTATVSIAPTATTTPAQGNNNQQTIVLPQNFDLPGAIASAARPQSVLRYSSSAHFCTSDNPSDGRSWPRLPCPGARVSYSSGMDQGT